MESDIWNWHWVKLAFGAILIFAQISHATNSPPPDLRDLRESARHIMRKSRCASCHIPGQATTKELALKVFNLDAKDWSSTMTDLQFEMVPTVASPSLTDNQAPGTQRIDLLTKSEKVQLMAFFEREKDYRKENPQARHRDIFKMKNPGMASILPKSCIL
jgi:hypothetical protein